MRNERRFGRRILIRNLFKPLRTPAAINWTEKMRYRLLGSSVSLNICKRVRDENVIEAQTFPELWDIIVQWMTFS